jgi:hypothetical protein
VVVVAQQVQLVQILVVLVVLVVVPLDLLHQVDQHQGPHSRELLGRLLLLDGDMLVARP